MAKFKHSHNLPQFNRPYLLSLSFVSAMGGYLFGFDIAVITGALPFLQRDFNLSSYWEGFTAGTLALGAMLGALTAGKFSDVYGRKKGLLIAAVLFGCSALAMAFSPTRNVFIVSRFIAGIGVGMASILSPMYIAEISPAQYRGRLVAINQLAIVTGILITNMVNYLLRNNGEESWRWMFGLGIIPSTLFLIGCLWLPESPRWLVKAGALGKARAILLRIGNDSFMNETIADIQESLKIKGKVNYRSLLRKPLFPILVTGVILAVFQQFCGINVVLNYTPRIFGSIGASMDNQLLQTVFIGLVNLIFTFVAMALVDKIGRKPLMLIGSGGLAVIFFLIARLLVSGYGIVAILLLLSIATYAMSLAPVTWVLISEIFPNSARGTASSIAVTSLWAAYFILIFTFPPLFEKLGDKTFYIYAIVCVLGFLFMIFRLKETRNKTLEELESQIS